jgi:hypothetical protein
MDRHAATRRLKHLAATAGIRMPRNDDALRPCPQNLDRHADYILAAYMASATFNEPVGRVGGGSGKSVRARFL